MVCGGLMEIQTPARILIKFCTHLSKGRFRCSFDPGPLILLGLGAETSKGEGHIFENCLQNRGCSVGGKLTRAAPGTSAGYKINF